MLPILINYDYLVCKFEKKSFTHQFLIISILKLGQNIFLLSYYADIFYFNFNDNSEKHHVRLS